MVSFHILVNVFYLINLNYHVIYSLHLMLQIFAINTLIQDLFVISTQSFKISVRLKVNKFRYVWYIDYSTQRNIYSIAITYNYFIVWLHLKNTYTAKLKGVMGRGFMWWVWLCITKWEIQMVARVEIDGLWMAELM